MSWLTDNASESFDYLHISSFIQAIPLPSTIRDSSAFHDDATRAAILLLSISLAILLPLNYLKCVRRKKDSRVSMAEVQSITQIKVTKIMVHPIKVCCSIVIKFISLP